MADVHLAEQLMGYRPEISAREGLNEVVNWFRQKTGRLEHGNDSESKAVCHQGPDLIIDVRGLIGLYPLS